jgi:hypothetical protein
MPDTLTAAERNHIRGEIIDREIEYWHEVDHSWGRAAHTMYTADGIFAIGPRDMVGPDAVKAFYTWRESRGARIARHVVTNLRVTIRSADEAELVGIMCLYAEDGVPVLPSNPPILVADVISRFVRVNGSWQFRYHKLVPLFEGGAATTVPPAQ